MKRLNRKDLSEELAMLFQEAKKKIYFHTIMRGFDINLINNIGRQFEDEVLKEFKEKIKLHEIGKTKAYKFEK